MYEKKKPSLFYTQHHPFSRSVSQCIWAGHSATWHKHRRHSLEHSSASLTSKCIRVHHWFPRHSTLCNALLDNSLLLTPLVSILHLSLQIMSSSRLHTKMGHATETHCKSLLQLKHSILFRLNSCRFEVR